MSIARTIGIYAIIISVGIVAYMGIMIVTYPLRSGSSDNNDNSDSNWNQTVFDEHMSGYRHEMIQARSEAIEERANILRYEHSHPLYNDT